MILNAATECFSQNGYEKTTLDDIGGKVRLNKASLYYYYSSKEDLFCDVIYSEAQRFREEVRSKAKAIRDVEARVVFFLVERTRFYRRLRYLHELTLNLARKIEPMFVTLKSGIRSEEKMILQDILNENFIQEPDSRWRTPDPNEAKDREALRIKVLLKEFNGYVTVISQPRAKKLKEVRVEALRAGFKKCWEQKDFKTIVTLGDMIPQNILLEDEQLLMYYDIAKDRV